MRISQIIVGHRKQAMLATQPRKVHRYQPISARAIESLCHDTLYFADPATFNDPLDCKPQVVSDSDSDTLREILTELIKRRVAAETRAALSKAQIQGQKAGAHANRAGKIAADLELENIAYNATDPEFQVGVEQAECHLLTQNIQHEILKQYHRGVCCFSATKYNPLLWSHYADEHRGVCIGYSLDRVPEPKLHRVVYGGSRSVKTSLVARALLENDQEAQELLDRDVLLRKSPSWRYEREWRLLGNRGVHDSSLELADVTFGLRCPDALKYALVSALDGREAPVKFFEMCESDGTFRLRRRVLETRELGLYFPQTARSGQEFFGSVESG